jgi:hypothetical protein
VVVSFNRVVHNIKRLLLKSSFIFKVNAFVKYYYRFLVTDSTEIDRFLNKSQFVIYDNVKKMFRINDINLSWPQKISIRRLFMREVRKISPTSIKLKDILDTHYYDRCLERYIYERLCENKRNEDTCWYQDAQNNKCVGWYDPQKPFDLEGKKEFIKEKAAERPAWGNVTDLEPLERDDAGNVFCGSSIVYKEDDRTLELVDSVQKNGFSNWRSLSPPIVLGYSTSTKRFNAIAGRHRIAALKYLQKQGIVSGQLDIRCHIVEYPFESLAYTRPYSVKCKQCMNNDNS